MVKRLWGQKFFRFLCVGAGNTLLDFTLLNILTLGVHVPALLANIISASIGISISYFLNHRIVFRRDEEHSLQKFVHFFVVTGLSILLIQTLVIWLVTTLLSDQELGGNSFLLALHLRTISPEVINLN